MEENNTSAPMSDAPKKSGKGMVIGLIIVIVIGAAVYLSTQTDLLKGTLEVNNQPTTANVEASYNAALEKASSEAERDKAHSDFIKETVEILEATE